jgi:hypothetical protein
MRRIISVSVLVALISICPTVAKPATSATGDETAAVAQLLDDLGSDDWQVQRDAAAELGERGPDNLGVVIPLLKSANAHARRGVSCLFVVGVMTTTCLLDMEETRERQT